MEEHQAFRLVGIKPEMDRTEVCIDKSSPYYHIPGVDGIAKHEVEFTDEEKGSRP